MSRSRLLLGTVLGLGLLATPVRFNNAFASDEGFITLNEACAQGPIEDEEASCKPNLNWHCVIGEIERFHYCDTTVCGS